MVLPLAQDEPSAPGSLPRSSEIARVFAALAHPARIDILRHVALHQNCGCKEITEVLPLAQSTISQHLKVLIEAEIIVVETIPPRSRYQVNADLLKEVACTTSTFLDSCCDGSCS